jgi:hypothetical protein
MKRLIILVALVSILAGLHLSGMRDTSASLTDSNMPVNEIPTSQAEGSNAQATATITITMAGVINE